MRRLANVRVRNVATVGGNLAHADPHLDLPPVWIALGAHALVVGGAGEREVPVEDFFTGYYETVLRHDEVVAELIVPSQRGRRAAYLKCTTRSADDWPALGVAVSLALEDGAIAAARVAVGAATATADAAPRRRGGAARRAARRCRRWRAPARRPPRRSRSMSDDRGSAAYKKHLLRVYLGRAVKAALSEAA